MGQPTTSMSQRYRRASTRASLGAAAFVFLALLLPPLFGLFYYGVDLTRVDLAMLCAIKERLGSGQGLWLSPLLENGGPLLARPDAELLYPPRWVAIALPVEWGLAWNIAFHLAVGAGAAAWLARTFGARPITAAAIGVTFAFCGTSLDLIRHAHYISAAAWLPLTWAAARRSVRPRGLPLDWLAVGVGLAGCLLGAEPQAFLLAAALVGLESVLALGRSRSALPRVAQTCAIAAAGGAIGMSQWWLTMGELGLSRRGDNLPVSEALRWSFSPPLWLGTILQGVPLEPVQPVTNVWQIWSKSIEAYQPWNAGPYLGAFLIVALACGVWIRRARIAAGVVVVGLLFALGDYTRVLPTLMGLIPQLARFRYPSKYLLIVSLAAAVVAGLFLDRLARSRPERRAFIAVGLAMVALFGAGLVWTSLNAEALNAIADAMRPTAHRPNQPDLPLLSEALSASLLHGLAPLAIALLLLGFGRLRPYLSMLVALDVLMASPFLLFVGPGVAALPSPLAKFRSNAVRPAEVFCIHPNVATRFFDIGGRVEWDQTLAMRQNLMPELQACDGLASGLAYSPLESSMSVLMLGAVMQYRDFAFRAMGCTHVVLDARRTDSGQGTYATFPIEVAGIPELTQRGFRVHVLELARPLPMVFVARIAALKTSEAEVLQALGSAASPEVLMGVIDDPLQRLAPGASLPHAAADVNAWVEWITADHARIEVTGTGPAVIGVRTSFLAGWQAVQGGHPVAVVRATGNHVAVVIDASAGPVELRYRAANLGVSAASASFGVVLGALVFGLALVQRKSRREKATTAAVRNAAT
jgi:hypothetical protein